MDALFKNIRIPVWYLQVIQSPTWYFLTMEVCCAQFPLSSGASLGIASFVSGFKKPLLVLSLQVTRTSAILRRANKSFYVSIDFLSHLVGSTSIMFCLLLIINRIIFNLPFKRSSFLEEWTLSFIHILRLFLHGRITIILSSFIDI